MIANTREKLIRSACELFYREGISCRRGRPDHPGRRRHKNNLAILFRYAIAQPEVKTMAKGHKWIIVLIAYDDPQIETRVLKERIAAYEDEQLAALLRGGELVATLAYDNEAAAEAQRIEIERSCLR
jgi:hypothetical protein